jgi:hypothetical protein
LIPSQTESEPWRWLVGVQAFWMTTVAPEAVPGIAWLLGVAQQGDGFFAPRFRLALGRTVPESVESRAGDAVFTLTLARAEACPLGWPRASVWRIRPCVQAETGRLEAEGQVPNGRKATVLWGAGSLVVAAELVLFRHLGTEAQFGLVFPWLRDSYVMPPDQEPLHEIPPVGWMGGLSVTALP